MKKIMFNDKYGLTQAVLEGRKTMTRRIINQQTESWLRMQYNERYDDWHRRSPYMYIETLAISQAYQDIYNDAYHIGLYGRTTGWTNKMFVRSKLMPHHIKITNIRVERLQDISDEDCLREGIRKWDHNNNPFPPAYDFINSPQSSYKTPREAFAALIDKVSGKGTWQSNPFVWAYEFELVD